MVFQQGLSPFLKQTNTLLLALQQSSQFLSTILHALGHSVQRPFLPINDSKAQLLDLHEIGAEVLTEAFLIAVYTVVSEDISFNGAVVFFESSEGRTLFGQLVDQ